MTKQELRIQIKKNLQTHQSSFKAESFRICKKIISSDLYKTAKIILSYMALPDEVNLSQILTQAQNDKKKIFIPKVYSDAETLPKMDFFEITQNVSLTSGNFGILEPDSSNPPFDFNNYQNERILIFVPGRAFSKNGERLGRGKGYYDNYLKNKLPNYITVGICFPFQIVNEIPVEPHDFKMDFMFF